MRKQHKNNTHLNCKSDICEKTASSEKFRLEIDLNFLENMNVLIVDRPPCSPLRLNSMKLCWGSRCRSVAIEEIDPWNGILSVYSSILLLFIRHFFGFIIKTLTKMIVT